jgi:hypothetical protein
MVRPPSAKRLRRGYTNVKYPLVILRFEDGHEIVVRKGESKAFDAFVGETIRIIAVWDPAPAEREVISVMKAEQFMEAK